jgi:hypothetical protein
MIAIGLLFVRMLCDCFKSRRRLEAEILVLRHQLNVLHQGVPRRAHLRWADRALFIWLYRRCPRIFDAITIVRPETVVRWHVLTIRSYLTPSTFGECLRDMGPIIDIGPIIMSGNSRFAWKGHRPAHVRSSAWEILSRIRSWAGYTIDTRESNFSEATGFSHSRSKPVVAVIRGGVSGKPKARRGRGLDLCLMFRTAQRFRGEK